MTYALLLCHFRASCALAVAMVPTWIKNGSAKNVGWVSRVSIDRLGLVAIVLNLVDAEKVVWPPWWTIDIINGGLIILADQTQPLSQLLPITDRRFCPVGVILMVYKVAVHTSVFRSY